MLLASRQRAASPYDADNRVDVDGGDLVNGTIQVVARTGSVEHEYDQAGEVVTQLSNDGTGLKTQTFGYDARGEQIGSILTGGVQESRQYDADGRLTADVYAYAATATASYTNVDGTFSLPIGGWLVSATTYYYNADGEVTATFDYSRDVSNADYWNGLGQQYDNGTLDTVAQQTIPTTLPSLSDAANGVGYGDNGSGQALLTLRSQVTHWDPDTSRGISGYDAEGHAWKMFDEPDARRG